MGGSPMSTTELDTLRDSAGVVIDLANAFVSRGGVIADGGGRESQRRAQAIIPPLRRLLEAARRTAIPIVYATDAHEPGDSELQKWPPHAMRGTRWAEVVPDLAPQPGDVVLEKRTYSPFVSSELDSLLTARGIKTLSFTGLHTDCCARHTSGDAFQRGYDLVWVTDALQAFTDEAHRQGLDYFKAWYATDPARQLRTADQVIADWRGGAVEATRRDAA